MVIMTYDALLDSFNNFRNDLDISQSIKDNKSAIWAVFALTLKFPDETPESLINESLVDSSDDGKVDLIFFNEEAKKAIIIQTAYSTKIKDVAPTNKADDLNTAASWLLSRNIDEVPERIRTKTEELRNYLNNKNVETIEFWYVHNCKDSDAVKRNLVNVESTSKNALESMGNNTVTTFAREMGIDTILKWYKESETPILVSDEFRINVKYGYPLSASKWNAYMTSVSAEWLYLLYRQYGDELFYANIRGYMGGGRKDKSINNGIKATCEQEPENFWIYNNGITCMVNGLNVEDKADGTGKIVVIKGISIVNGAQTTGAVSELANAPQNAYVPIRFVRCEKDVIDNIIEYNNTQNSIKSADFRSRDAIQKRLMEQFSSRTDVKYEGRRSVLVRPSRNVIFLQRDEVAQIIAAFHQYPFMAYHQKTKIWEDESKYDKIFNDSISSVHIIFAETLYRAIISIKEELMTADPATLTDTKKKQLEFFRKRGSTIILTTAIAHCLEIVISRPIPDPFKVAFKDNIKFLGAVDLWKPLVNIMLPFHSKLDTALQNGRIIENPENNIDDFRSAIEATSVEADQIKEKFNVFSSNCQILQ